VLIMKCQQPKRGHWSSLIPSSLASLTAAVLLAGVAGVAGAQDENAEDAKQKQELPTDKTVKPHAASIEPRARYELLLDVEHRGDKGFVTVGARGNLLLSTDGLKWEQKKVPVRAMLTAVDFVDAKKGWAVGHDATIIGTADGGETWELQNFDPELETPFLDVAFFDQNKGFAIGAYDLFFKTTDGGKTWEEYEEPLSVGEWHLNGIARLNDGTMVIVGETGLVSRSTDAGETWQLIEGPYSGSYFGIKALGEKGAIVYGLRGHAFVTDDVSKSRELPADTDLGYKFKKPPTMSDDGDGDKAAAGAPKSAEEAAVEQAAFEREQAEKAAAKSSWKVVKNDPSVLSLFGATTLKDGGYVLVGTNGIMWISDDNGPDVRLLPNTKDGGLSAVSETKEGNLVLVGEPGVFLYKRNK